MKQSFNLVLFVFLSIGLVYCSGLLTKAVEGFGNPFEDLVQKIMAAQSQGQVYDQWLGYVYKNAPENSNILNDFKQRAFHPSCKFRKNWATVPPKGMNIPTGASTKDLANLAYKNYMKCLEKGTSTCMDQLDNARKRLMEPGCHLLHTTSYSQDFTVLIN